MKFKSIFKLISINLFTFFTLIFCIELFSLSLRKVKNKDFVGFLYQKNNLFTDNCQRMQTHPLLNHVHDHQNKCSVKGGIVDGKWVIYNNKNSSDNIILILGGSTTDGLYNHISNGFTWPLKFSEILNNENLNYQIWNGGVGSYQSKQELIKVLIEIPKLRSIPKYIISLNGINEEQVGKSLNYPFLSLNQLRMISEKKYINQNPNKINILPSTKSLVRSLLDNSRRQILYSDPKNKEIENWEKSIYSRNYKIKKNNDVANWEYNVKVMNAIAKAIGSKYYVFLQPTMGISPEQIPKDLDSNDGKLYLKAKKNNSRYFNKIKQRYKGLRDICSTLDYCIDISNEVQPTGNVYNDIRHHNSKGNQILANIIFESLKIKDK